MTIPKLHFGGPQTIILVVFIVIAVSLFALFTLIALSSRQDVEFPRVQKIGYWIRARWLVLLIAIAAVQVGISLFHMPYSVANKPDFVVKVQGYQFNWSVDRPKIPAGSLVRFDVSSSDVNHGLGLYDPDGVMLGTVQAMPGYVNKVEFRLNKPGTYLISCMEFCGIGHHKMMRNLEVVKGP
ncbi:MAG: hypothetical protein JJE27_03055 [Thermoleophilia bacterium]|nr:hypothetical protein [Thermoleophilia bacterium]